MKRLIERIAGLENSVEILVKKLTSLKEENQILLEQKERLIHELNQLKGGLDHESHETLGVAVEKKNSESDIKVEVLRQELDRCILEVEACIKML